jgi:hypothetical protein
MRRVPYERAFPVSVTSRRLIAMDHLEHLRALIGPEAAHWNRAQLEQLDQDLDVMAMLLLRLYRQRMQVHRAKPCDTTFDSANLPE